MELQKSILLFFSNIDIKFLDKLVEVITMFGESVVPIVIALFIIWCIDKKKGILSVFSLLIACSFMSTLKAVVRFPRPWTVMPELQTGRIHTATGYSFPSGHSTTAASFYSSIAVLFSKKVLSIICSILIFLVPLSRLYLCVHWPLDVCCGTMLGIGTTFIFINRLIALYEKRFSYHKQIVFIGIVIALIGFVQSLLVQLECIDFLAFSDFSKNLGMLAGIMIGFPIEEKYCNFSVEGTWGRKIVRYLVGLVVALLILEGVKKILPYVAVISFFRYFSTALWITMYPMVGRKLKLFS